MAKDSKIQNIGDSLIVTVNPKAVGKMTLTSYQDELLGITASRSVSRDYRIIEDEIFATSWKPLDDSLNLVIETSNSIQIRYIRTGTDSTGVIEFVSIDFLGSFEAQQFEAPTINSSIFANTFNTPEVIALEKNIFKKLYFRGIIPRYITRGDNMDREEDEDYVVLFSTVAKFFSMLVRFFKRYETFDTDFGLMLEWVRQRGIYFDESSVTLEELQYLAQNYYDEIRKRGTKMIFARKGDVLPDGTVVQIDGELIRLIRSKIDSELLYENIPLYKIGWWGDRMSPLYKGTARAVDLNKTKENTEDFQNLDNFLHYPVSGSQISLAQTDGRTCVRLKTGIKIPCGLGNVTSNMNVDNYLYVADPKMDYEITFAFKVDQTTNIGDVLNFGVEGYDRLKNKLNDAFILPNGDSTSEMFLSNLPLNNFIQGKWYYVRGIIHAYSSRNIDETKTNIGYGNNLFFNNSFVKYIIPKIYINAANTTVYLWDYKIRPLVRGTNILPLKNGKENSHSLGFIQCAKIFYMYLRNNNNSQSEREITDIIEKYLLPFNMTDMLTYIGNE